MNILMYAHFAGSPEMGMVFGHYYLAREWVRAGHKVTIVCASFVHTRKHNPQVNRRYTPKCIDGIDYVFVKCPIYDPINNFGRALNILTFGFFSQFYKPSRRPDVVITSSHHTLTAFVARRLAVKFDAKFVFEVRDLWPLSLVELGSISKSHPFIKLLQFGEDYALKHAHRVVSVLPNASEYFCSRGMAPEKFLFVPNGADLNAVCKPLGDNQLLMLRLFKSNHGKLMGYVGSLSNANNLIALVRALPELSKYGMGIVFVGEGPERAELERLGDSTSVSKNMLFLGSIDKSMVKACLGLVDVAYFGLQGESLYQFGISPTKMNDYLMSGVPTVFAVDFPSELEKAGPLVARCKAGDSDAISHAAIALCNLNKEELVKGREQARSWLEGHRDYRVLAHRFLEGL